MGFGCDNEGPFSLHVCLPNNWSEHTVTHVEPRRTPTDDRSGGWTADSSVPRLLPTSVSLTIRLQADRGARFSHCVQRLCQTCSTSKCTGGPSWSQSSPINDGPISSSRDLWAGKWKAWRCRHLYKPMSGCVGHGHPSSPRASSAPLIRWGCIIHQIASKWRKDIHHCPPFKLDPTDVAISQTHQYSALAEGSPAETSPPLRLYKPHFSGTTAPAT